MADIQKFDPSAMASAVRDKIRGTIMELIPEEQWTAMVQAEIDAFLTDRHQDTYYSGQNRQPVPCGFKQAVLEVLRKETEARCKAAIDALSTGSPWAPELISAHIGKIVADHGPEMIDNWLRQTLRTFFERVRNGT